MEWSRPITITKQWEMAMHLILGLIVGSVALLQFGIGGALLGAVVGALAAEILALRKRLAVLERNSRGKIAEVREDEEVVFAPAAVPPPIDKKRPQRFQPVDRAPEASIDAGREAAKEKKQPFLDRFFESLGQGSAGILAKARDFFTTGNIVLKIGVIIVFFGVAFLLKYAAQRDMVPLELRLAGIAVLGVALLVVGWRMRQGKTDYGLVLQGGGVGVLYLVVFAAAKLYAMLPMVMALAIMVGLVALSCLLAIMQDARALAVFGAIGGFLAPVLMSTGGGSHILLFSYYALLNAGIFAIAWAKSWRELYLVGFIFTFAIGTLWGSSGYRPEHFATTEPFLLLFFVFYVLISILFADRQPLNLRGFIDGPLVFGLPLIVSGLQYYLVRDMQFGMAFSALALGLFYLALAFFLWRRLSQSMHLLCETFLALGVVFGSLAIPLALDGHWSASIWALEGAGMVWVGAKQQRVLARHFGLLLQFAAAFIFLDSVWYPLNPLAFANRYYLGCLFLALAPLIAGFFLDRYKDLLKSWERYYPLPLLIWGLLWWYYGGIREIDHLLVAKVKSQGFLFYCSLSTVLFGMAVSKLPWSRLALALLIQLPVMVLLVPTSLLAFYGSSHLFVGWGGAVWGIAFFVQYRALFLFAEEWPKKCRFIWHIASFWLLFFVLCHEASWGVDQLEGLSAVWSMICWAIIPSGAVLLLIRLGRETWWPVVSFPAVYLCAGGALPAVGLFFWVFASFSLAGNPAPLPYLPLVNPLELTGILAILTLFLWLAKVKTSDCFKKYLPEKFMPAGVGILLFLLLNSMVARLVHFYAGIPYYPHSLYHSAIFQAALAGLWGFGALATTFWATRKGSRPLWIAGAILLGMVVVKLFIVDLSGTGTIARIVSFLVVGVLMLIIGYFSPLPPNPDKKERHLDEIL